MRQLERVALALVALSVASSCTVERTGRVSGGDDVAAEQRGVVSGSFGCKEIKYFTNYHIFFRSLDKQVDGSIHLGADGLANTALDWTEDSWKGFAFRYSLPAGRYEFYNVRFFQNGYPATYTASSRQDFSVPFEVKRGENVYIGEIRCYLIGNSAGYYVFSDKSQRDLEVIHRKFPETSQTPTSKSIPDPSSAATPFVRRVPL